MLVHPEPVVADEDDGMVEGVLVDKVEGSLHDLGEFEGCMDWILWRSGSRWCCVG